MGIFSTIGKPLGKHALELATPFNMTPAAWEEWLRQQRAAAKGKRDS